MNRKKDDFDKYLEKALKRDPSLKPIGPGILLFKFMV